MKPSLFIMTILIALILVLSTEAYGLAQQQPSPKSGKVPAFDDFDRELGLKWDIVNPHPSNYSLTKKPGTLTITTQDGHFKEANSNYKNLFLIDTPVPEGQDFQITTCLSDFRPLEAYNQAGLICWDDEDNYLEWVYQKMRRRGLNFNAGVEANGPTGYTYIPADGPFDKLWLRLTKRGKSYECSSSVDGKSFTVRSVQDWGDGSPKQVGLFATNGSLTNPPEVDASFEFFEVVSVPAKKMETVSPQPKPTSQQALRYEIPKSNLQIPDELKLCAERLRTIYNALKRYEKDKGSLPDWLSDLAPNYLSAEILIWPKDGPQSTPLAPDRHLPRSFGYQYSSSMTLPQGEMSYREFKDKERKIWGDAVPLVRYYIDIDKKCLNISFDGRVYMSESAWETEIKPQEGTPEILVLKTVFVPATPISDKKTEAAAEPQSVSRRALKYRIPEQNLDIPDELKACAERLRTIYTALKKYEKEKDRMPDWLSDLVPSYLEAEMLFCPDDKSHQSSYWPDPKLACSYCYELNPSRLRGRPPLDKTMLHYKTLQRGLFGDVVPIVRCFHHGRVLNLAWDGRIYTSPLWFEQLFIPNYSHRMLFEVSPDKSAAPPERAETLAVPESKVLAFDDFDGNLGLKWDIINPHPSNFSLTKNPGTLTISTQDGHFKEANSNYKNLFLIDTPVPEGQDFQITTCLSDFRPLEAYNQAGLICWDDEDNYLEWVYQKMRKRGLNFNAGVEANGPTGYTYIPAEGPFDRLWLRITKRGKSYECSSSVDGKSFTVRAVENWGDGSPKQIGLFAINGSLTNPPGVDASFEFFKVVAVPDKKTETEPPQPKSASQQAALRYEIPEANLQIPEEMKPCSENLQKIHEALEQYKKDKGELPGFLSDLVPDYLGKEALLCPTHPSERPPLISDPKLPCSYGYQYSNTPFSIMTQRQWKDEQRRICGDIVPLVRCYGHGQCLNLSFGGRMYISSLVWERDLDPEGGALRQSASPSQSGTTQSLTTPVQRGEGGVSFEEDLEAFFREMDNTYPFFDLKGIRNDWEQTKKELRRQIKACGSDEQFLEIATKAVLCLRDGHMGFQQLQASMPPRPRKYYAGVSLMPATDRRVVLMTDRTDLDPDLKTGTVVTMIDGEDARKFLEGRADAAWAEGGGFSSPQRARLYEFRIPLRGEQRGEKHRITILVSGEEREVKLSSDTEAGSWPHWYNQPEGLTQVGGSCWYGRLPSGIGYIYLRRIDGSTGKGMKEAFSTHADVKGWIIDLRGNGGGGYDSELYEALRTLPRPLAGIIDAGCFSAGETLARDLVQYGNARLFGSPTAGSSSAKRTWSFPSGIASILLSRRSRWGISGQPIEFNGIRPDENVEAVPEEVQRGLNSAILRAEEYLAEVAASETR